MSKFKNEKSIFVMQYRIPQQINKIFEVLGLYCCGVTALA